MKDDSWGIEGLTAEDERDARSRFAEVRDAILENPYRKPYEVFPVTLGSLLHGILPFGKPWQFRIAAKRTVGSHAVLRWGPDRKGYRRILHPSGVCLFGRWEIMEETPYSGYFRGGSRGVVIARYSAGMDPRGGRMRSLAMVGRIWPTTDPEHPQPLPTANFITQEDIGGAYSRSINEAVLRNAPDTSISRRNLVGAAMLFTTGLALRLADKKPTIRQVYEIAEIGKNDGEPTRAPEFLQLTVPPEQPVIPGENLDVRDEVMAQVYDTPQRSLTFRIETSDTGTTHGPDFQQHRTITDWRHIGNMTFDAAAVSFNGDRVFHVHHPRWRRDRNDPNT
jgi:hypothetical protein